MEIAAERAAAEAPTIDDAPVIEEAPPSAHREHADLLLAAEAELAAINDALRRLDDESYGRCSACGEPIAELVLETDPLTTTCPSCAAA